MVRASCERCSGGFVNGAFRMAVSVRYSSQEHPPGRQGLSDFTVADDLGITIGGAAYPHRLYQFALAHSGWRHVSLVEGGESFIALATGLQDALWRAGGTPEEHRTDSLSAAFRNLPQGEAQQLTKRYESLCTHYGMRATRCNPGESQENGSIEARNGSLKVALRQGLMLRGSSAFEDRAAYVRFVESIVARMNGRVAARFAAERNVLRPLPARRTADFEEITTRVSKYGLFTVKGMAYSAPSRLIGYRLSVRYYADRVECWFGGERVHECVRAASQSGPGRARQIDYRHLIDGLKRKPGAFARSVLRDDLFPRSSYRQTWKRLQAQLPEREACKTIVGILALAADGHEAELSLELERLLDQRELPNLDLRSDNLAPRPTLLPSVEVPIPKLGSYDPLLGVAS